MTEPWSVRDIDILQALTLKVRVLTEAQLARAWWGDEAAGEQVLRQISPLCELGLIERLQVFAHPLIKIAPPAFYWKPGDPNPDVAKIASLAEHFQRRWTEPEIPFTVYVATKAAASLVGSYILERPNDDQWTHDIHVAEIYVQMMLTNPADKMRFVVGEGALPKLGLEVLYMKDPDLFIVDEFEQAVQVIEFAGAYDEKHVQQLHDHCSGEAYRKLVKRYPDRKYRLYPKPEGTPYLLI